MGLIDKIYKLTRTADMLTSISSKVGNGSSLLGGLNLNNFDINNLGSFGSSIESTLNGVSSDITSQLTGMVDVNEIQNMASSITPQDVGIDFSSIENQFSGLDANSLGIDMNDIDLGLDDIDLGDLGLDKIRFM